MRQKKCCARGRRASKRTTGNATAARRLFYCVYASPLKVGNKFELSLQQACVCMCALHVCCVCVCAHGCVCVCYMATAAATQRLNLFSTKLNHQKFANNNAGVIYLTHGISLGCLESASRSRSNSDGNGNNNNKQRATPQTTMCCSAHNMAKKKKNQPKHTHSI